MQRPKNTHVLPYLPTLLHLHTLYIDFFIMCLTVCLFMCNYVLLFLSHCFALSWPGRSYKWKLVLNWSTWLNKNISVRAGKNPVQWSMVIVVNYSFYSLLPSVLLIVLVESSEVLGPGRVGWPVYGRLSTTSCQLHALADGHPGWHNQRYGWRHAWNAILIGPAVPLACVCHGFP